MAVNVGQLTQTAKALSAIDWTQVAGMNLGDLSSDAVLAEDVLSVVAVFWPPAALFAEALAIALEPILAASGFHISPDPNPEVDAQTAHDHGGRS